jgi:heat shock protein HslJ
MNRKYFLLWLMGIVIFVSLLGCSQETEELAATEWELVFLNGKDLIEGTAITLVFAETYLGGQMGCNGYGGTADTGKYLAKGDGSFTLGSPFAVTVQLCSEPPGIMEQEAAYIEVFQTAAHFEITGDRLELKNQAGEVLLVYQRK